MKRFLPFLVLLLPSLSFSYMNTDYYQAGSNMFVCASTVTATIPAVSAAGVNIVSPLVLYNPAGSGIKMVILDTGVNVVAAPAAASGLFLAYNLAPSTGPTGTSGTLTSAYVGQSTGTFVTAKGQCFAYATLPAVPVMFRTLGGTTGAAAIGGVEFNDQPNNHIVIPPGGTVSFGATSATNFIAHITWLEFPQ